MFHVCLEFFMHTGLILKCQYGRIGISFCTNFKYALKMLKEQNIQEDVKVFNSKDYQNSFFLTIFLVIVIDVSNFTTYLNKKRSIT